MPDSSSPEQELQNVGQRLALLLVASDLPDDVKEAVVALVPEMTLAQMDQLAGILARAVKDGSSAEFAMFYDSLKNLKKGFDAEEQAIRKKALDHLEAIKKKIP